MESKYTAEVDYENNSEIFWEAFRERPELSKLPIVGYADKCEVTPEQIEIIKSLPGWGDPDAPEYAPHPLLLK